MPKYTHDIVKNYENKNIKQATKMQIDILELVQCLFSEVNPIPVKAGLNMIGFDFGIPRMPLIEISDINSEKLKKVISYNKSSM